MDVKKLRGNLGLTQKELADKIGVSVNTIQNYEKGGVIPVSRQQLLVSLQELAMSNVDVERIEIDKNSTVRVKEKGKDFEWEGKATPYGGSHLNHAQRVIRYWTDVDVTGGGVELFEDSLTDNYEDMIIPEFRDCTDAVNLYGDSMSPRYNPGQIIILKEWTDSFIAFGQVYLVITKSGFRTVKYLRKGDKANEVLCVSENPNYDPFPIELTDVIKMYLVKGVIEKTTL